MAEKGWLSKASQSHAASKPNNKRMQPWPVSVFQFVTKLSMSGLLRPVIRQLPTHVNQQ